MEHASSNNHLHSPNQVRISFPWLVLWLKWWPRTPGVNVGIKDKIKRKFKHDRLAKSTVAVAGLTGAASTVVGVAASAAAPTGLSAVTVALGITSAPLIVTAAPIIGGVAAAAAAVAGTVRFYSWLRESEPGDEDGADSISDR